jgi:hypothetical protein
MPDLCHNAISLPEVENFKKTIHPYIHDRFEKVFEDTDDEGHTIYAMLPTGIPMMRREIDLDLEKIVPMPEPIKRTRDDSFDEDSDEGQKLMQANLLHYGQADWYSWVQENWGTKRSYYGEFRSQEKSFFFLTPWQPPIAAIVKLATLLRTPVQLDYVDEDDLGYLGRSLCRPDGNNIHIRYEQACKAPLAIQIGIMKALRGWRSDEYEERKNALIRERKWWHSLQQKNNA